MVGKKLALNFGVAAARTLGLRQWTRSWFAFLRALPHVLVTRDLGRLDQIMGGAPVCVRFMGRRFTVDCPACDLATSRSADSSHAFGLVRELFVRNCYLQSFPSAENPMRYVVDGGANRGLFALFAASAGARVVAVEPTDYLCSLIHHHMRINGLDNYAVEQTSLGASAPAQSDHDRPVLSIPDVMKRHGLPRIDLLKLDIEGAEFALFGDAVWLDRVSAVTMEVHASHGAPASIVRTFEEHGFSVCLRNEALELVNDPSATVFLYAQRSMPVSRHA